MTAFPGDVTAAIICYNAIQRLPLTLEALRESGCSPEKIIVVDNRSTDGAADWVEKNWPNLRLIRMPANNGPNPARNAAIRMASTPYILLIDDDILIRKDTAPLLHDCLAQDTSAAIATPTMVHIDRPGIIQYAGTELHFMCEAINEWKGKPLDAGGSRPVPVGVSPGGAMLLVRSAAGRVGLFDEAYFIGKADGDFSQMIRLAGYRILWEPRAVVTHNGSDRGARRYYYQIRNRWYFMLKNYQWRTLLLLSPVLLLHEALEFILLAVKGHALTYFSAAVGLLRMLPTVRRERRRVSGFRALDDTQVLKSGPLLVSDSVLGSGLALRAKALYDRFLQGYWSRVSRIAARPAGFTAAAYPELCPIFVVGASRSGTTLVQLLLNAHPNIAMYGELHYFDQILQIKKQVPALRTREDIDRFFVLIGKTNAIKRLSEAENVFEDVQRRLLAEDGPGYETFYRFVLEEFARRNGARRFGEKTPENVRYLGQLLKIFPNARVIHMVRDPRAVVASALKVPWTANDAVINTLKWRFDVQCGQEFARKQASCLEVRYEDLVNAPEQTLRQVCQFLGEEYQPEMLDFHIQAGRFVEGQPWKDNTRSPINTRSLDSWKAELTSQQAALVEKLAGALLDDYGYPAAPSSLSSQLRLPKAFASELKSYVGYKRGEMRRRKQHDADTIHGENTALQWLLIKSLFKRPKSS